MGAIANIIENEVGPRFQAAGANFNFINSDYHLHKTTQDEIVILKHPTFLKFYEPIFERAPKRNVLEFGVFEGGSIILFALAYPDFRFVGIDIRPPNEHVLRHIHDLGLGDRVKIFYNTSQADKEQVEKIISDEFKDRDIAIISDDASHNYRLSKATFEITFGKVVPGGFYCLEDWGWAHWREPYQTQLWVDQPALTNLVFQITMMYASTQGMITTLDFLQPALLSIRRGGAQLGAFELESLIRMRGKTLTLI